MKRQICNLAREVAAQGQGQPLRRHQSSSGETALQGGLREAFWRQVEGLKGDRRAERESERIRLIDSQMIEQSEQIIENVGVTNRDQVGAVAGVVSRIVYLDRPKSRGEAE